MWEVTFMLLYKQVVNSLTDVASVLSVSVETDGCPSLDSSVTVPHWTCLWQERCCVYECHCLRYLWWFDHMMLCRISLLMAQHLLFIQAFWCLCFGEILAWAGHIGYLSHDSCDPVHCGKLVQLIAGCQYYWLKQCLGPLFQVWFLSHHFLSLKQICQPFLCMCQ